MFATMLAGSQKSNQASSLQGQSQLIATRDRSLRAVCRPDELDAPTAMPNRQMQQLTQESAAHGGCHTPNYNSRSAKNEAIRRGEDRIQGGRIDDECDVRSERNGSRSANSGRAR